MMNWRGRGLALDWDRALGWRKHCRRVESQHWCHILAATIWQHLLAIRYMQYMPEYDILLTAIPCNAASAGPAIGKFCLHGNCDEAGQ